MSLANAMSSATRDSLVDLFRQTAKAHHTAFAATDGFDLDWPIWYADYLLGPLADHIDMAFTRSLLVYCLLDADFEHQARAKDRPWQDFYADEFVERFAPSENPGQDKLALYHFDGCPFCAFVRSAIDRLELDVELRDIFNNPGHRRDLIGARGRATVPVLHITSPNGIERWMPESQFIVQYLEATYG